MHDPMTQAHVIKYPWFKYKPWPKTKRERDPEPFRLKREWEEMPEALKAKRERHWPEGYCEDFIIIWHVDPERDGTDDSCGYSYPKITKTQREQLRNAAWWEGQHPHYLCCAEKEWEGTYTEAECLYRGLVALVVRVLDLKFTTDEITRYAIEGMHIRTGGKAGDVFCFKAGYHTNSQNDTADDRRDHFHGILCNVARGLLDAKRPWWKHPKWHFWHWQFQCQPLLHFKRWAFSRCAVCGKRFKYYESPISNQWDGTGPLWFRSETGIVHESCSGASPVRDCVDKVAPENTPEPS